MAVSRVQVVAVLPNGAEYVLSDDRDVAWKRLSIEGQIQAITLGGNHHRFVVLDLADGGVIELPVDTAREVTISTRPGP